MPLVERADQDGVRTLTLNRPEVRNAISIELLEALDAEVAAAAREARCVVLTGAGQAFSAGGDVRQMMDRKGQAIETMQRLRTGLARVVERLHAMDPPVVARLHGDAVGAGLGLALACDLQVASATARVGAPFVPLGLVPDTGLTHELPRRMGLSRAKEMVFTARLLQATEAWEMGLLSRVVSPLDLDGEVRDIATRLAAMPTRVVGLAKRAMQEGAQGALDDALVREAYLQGMCFTLPEHAEGVQAFLEKRPPRFTDAGDGEAPGQRL